MDDVSELKIQIIKTTSFIICGVTSIFTVIKGVYDYGKCSNFVDNLNRWGTDGKAFLHIRNKDLELYHINYRLSTDNEKLKTSSAYILQYNKLFSENKKRLLFSDPKKVAMIMAFKKRPFLSLSLISFSFVVNRITNNIDN